MIAAIFSAEKLVFTSGADRSSRREDVDAGGAGRAVELPVAHPGRTGDLAVPRRASQLLDQLVHLAEPGGADGLAVGDEPAVGVDGQRPADLGRPPGAQP